MKKILILICIVACSCNNLVDKNDLLFDMYFNEIDNYNYYVSKYLENIHDKELRTSYSDSASMSAYCSGKIESYLEK